MYHRPKSCDCGVISVGRSGSSVSLAIIGKVLLPVYIVALGEVRAEMAAAALFAPQRGARDQPADGRDAADEPQIQFATAGAARPNDRFAPGGELIDGR